HAFEGAGAGGAPVHPGRDAGGPGDVVGAGPEVRRADEAVRVQIDQPRKHELPGDVQDCVAVRAEPRAHLGHEPVPHAHVQVPTEAGAGVEDVSALEEQARGQPAFRRTASTRSSAVVTMSLTSTHSFTVWISRIPHARFAISRPRPPKTLASEPPPVARVAKGFPRLAAARVMSLTIGASSSRPRRIAAIASEATLMALIPCSGHTPAWASRPWTTTSSLFAAGPRVTSSETPSTSSTRPDRARSRPTSKCLAPRRPYSS